MKATTQRIKKQENGIDERAYYHTIMQHDFCVDCVGEGIHQLMVSSSPLPSKCISTRLLPLA